MSFRTILVVSSGLLLAALASSCGDSDAEGSGAGAGDPSQTTSGAGPGMTTTTGGDTTSSSSSGGGGGSVDDDELRFQPELLGPGALPAPMGCEAKGSGTCRYVSPTGSGTNCTEAEPCRVAAALDLLGPGDVVLFLGGTYDASEGSEDRIYLDKYGPIATTADTPIVFTAVHGEEVILLGNLSDPCVWIDATPYLTFQGMIFDSCWEAGVRIAEDVAADTHHIVVRNNEFRNITCSDNMGAIMVNGAANVTFENNIVHDFSKDGTKGLGMVIFRGRDITVHNNEFYSLAEGIYYKHGEAAEGNGGYTHFYGNYFHDIGDGFALGVNQNRSEIAYNIFDDTGGVLLFQGDGTVGDFLFDVHIHHDTFIRSTVFPLQRGDGFSGAQDVTIDHSIFYDSLLTVWPYGGDEDFDAGVGFASDQNCHFDSSGELRFEYFVSDTFGAKGGSYELAAWQGLGFDVMSTVVDPQIDPASYQAAAAACAAYGAYGQ